MVLPHDFCDRCGKEYDGKKQFYNIGVNYLFPLNATGLDFSLCEKCFKEFSKSFDKWMDEMPREQVLKTIKNKLKEDEQ